MHNSVNSVETTHRRHRIYKLHHIFLLKYWYLPCYYEKQVVNMHKFTQEITSAAKHIKQQHK